MTAGPRPTWRISISVSLVVLAALSACRRHAPPEDQPLRTGSDRPAEVGRTLPNDANGPPPLAPISEGCRTSVNALPVVPLVVEWQEEETPKSFALGTDGYVRDHDTIVARVSGPCIVKPAGQTLLSVGANGTVVDEYHARVGVFQKRAALDVEGTPVPVQEVLASQGHPAIAIDAGGALYLVPSDRPPFSLPGGVTGEVQRGRRTALLLWYLGHRPTPPAH